MPPKPTTFIQFKGYSRDRFEGFRKQKEEIFHQKFGRFANKNTISTNSRESTMIEPGAMFALDTLYEDTTEKLTILEATVEDIRQLHSKLRLQTISQNVKDVATHKDKVGQSLTKIGEIESNIGEIKRLQLEDDRKYEQIIKRNLLTSMTIKLRDRAINLNKVKNINQDTGSKLSNFDFLENDVS